MCKNRKHQDEIESKTETLDLPRRASVCLEKRQSTKIESEDIAKNPKEVFSSGTLIPCGEDEKESFISSERKFKIVKMLRILVVDDNENIREMLEDFLNFEGHKPVLAKDGKEALKIFSEQDFDIVITDLGMPGMSGWELTDQIKQRKPEIPVVIITGWGAQLSAGDLKENKVDMILSKPFSLDRVKQMLETLRANLSNKKV